MCKNLKLIVAGLVMTGLFAGCGTSTPQTRSQELSEVKSQGLDDEPDWANNAPDGCGVGIVKYRGNRGLARNAATARGRDELARQLATTVEGMLKDYSSQGETDGDDFTEERITQVSRQIVDQTLTGTEVAATHLTEGNDAHLYSLVCLNPEAFAGIFDKMNSLSEKQRTALKQRAEVEFEDLDSQLEKHRAK